MTDRDDEQLARAAAAALGMPGARLAPVSQGLSSAAWLLRDDAVDGAAVLRVALPAARDGYRREHAVLARVADAVEQVPRPALRVPRPIAGHWTAAAPAPCAYSLTGWLAGPHLPVGGTDAAAEPVGRALRALHAVDPGGLGLPGSERGWPFDGSRADERVRAGLAPFTVPVRFAAAAQPAVLVHGDLHEENVVWPLTGDADGSAVGFLDFAMASAGAPMWDFAALAYFTSWEFAERALAAYAPDGGDRTRLRALARLLALAFAHRRLSTAGSRDEAKHAAAFLDRTLRGLDTEPG